MVKLPNLFEAFEKALKQDPKMLVLCNRLMCIGLFIIVYAFILALLFSIPFNLSFYSISLAFTGIGLTMLLSMVSIAANRAYSGLPDEEQKSSKI